MRSRQVDNAALMNEIAAERTELAEVLGALSPDAWEAQSLCAGWRVREVVAHMTMPFRYSTRRFVLEVIKDRGRFNRMADRCAHRDATMPTGELVAALADNAQNPWRPPGGGLEGALVHDVIHGLDINVALGIDRKVPEEPCASSSVPFRSPRPPSTSAPIWKRSPCGPTTWRGRSGPGTQWWGKPRTWRSSCAAESCRQDDCGVT